MAACDKRDFVRMAETNDLLYFFGGARKHHTPGRRLQARKAVRLVSEQFVGIAKNAGRADDALERLNEFSVQHLTEIVSHGDSSSPRDPDYAVYSELHPHGMVSVTVDSPEKQRGGKYWLLPWRGRPGLVGRGCGRRRCF